MTDGLYGDIEAIVIEWLKPLYGDCRVCSELPDTLPARTIQVVGIGGAPEAFPFALPRVDVDVYCQDRPTASDLARSVSRDLLFNFPSYRAADGTLVVGVTCDSGPVWAPYDNTTVRRFTTAYEIRTLNPI